MRVLFLVLLLANLLFLAWTRWVATPEPGVGIVAEQPSTPLRPIRLQQEAAGATGDTTFGGDAARDDAVAAASCVSVGPFLEPAHADAAAASLQRLGFAARLRSAACRNNWSPMP